MERTLTVPVGGTCHAHLRENVPIMPALCSQNAENYAGIIGAGLMYIATTYKLCIKGHGQTTFHPSKVPDGRGGCIDDAFTIIQYKEIMLHETDSTAVE